MEGFSYELDPELDAELAAARRRHAGAAPDTSAIAQATTTPAPANTQANQLPDISLEPEVAKWVESNLPRIVGRWQRFKDVPDFAAQTGLDDLQSILEFQIANNLNKRRTLNGLHDAKLALDSCVAEVEPGRPVGWSMELVAIPWKFFRTELLNLEERLAPLRAVDGYRGDEFTSPLAEMLKRDTYLYRTPSWDGVGTTAHTASSYLDMKVQKDGSWGFMLMQTSAQAGTTQFNNRALSSYRDANGLVQVAGVPVNAMGIFEALALTLQVGPAHLQQQGSNWLLANSFDNSHATLRGTSEDTVPVMHIDLSRSTGVIQWTASADHRAREKQPRLAVA